jgi:hypothetical protein
VDYLRRGRLENRLAPMHSKVTGHRRSRSGHKFVRRRCVPMMPRSAMSQRLLPGRQPFSWSRLARTLSRWSMATSACLFILGCFLFVAHSAYVWAGRNSENFDQDNPRWHEHASMRHKGLIPDSYDFGEPLPPSKIRPAPDLPSLKTTVGESVQIRSDLEGK